METDTLNVEGMLIEFGKLTLGPNDHLVIQSEHPLTRDQHNHIFEGIKKWAPDIASRTMILDPGLKLGKVEITEPKEDA